jgi:hypothetical protein
VTTLNFFDKWRVVKEPKKEMTMMDEVWHEIFWTGNSHFQITQKSESYELILHVKLLKVTHTCMFCWSNGNSILLKVTHKLLGAICGGEVCRPCGHICTHVDKKQSL